MIKFSQGESLALTVPFVDGNGYPIDLIDTTLTSLRAYFIIKDTVVSKFTDPLIELITGYGIINIVDANTLEFEITSEISKSLPIGNLSISVGYINLDGYFEVMNTDVATVEKGYVLKEEIYT